MAKLTAEMRLSLDALRQDAERAATIMQQTMAKKFGGGGMGGLATNPAATIQSIFTGEAAKTGMNRQMAALGIGAGIFSPWIGARLLNQSGMLNSLGGGGGGAIGKAIFGQGGFAGFGAAYIALQLASRLLKAAFDDLRRSVRDAAQLFFDAAKLRISPGQLMATKTTLKALGVDDSQELLQSLAYGRGRMGMKQMTQLVGIQGQSGAASYMSDFVEGDKRFWDEMARNSRDFHVLWTAFSYELQTISATIVNGLLPAFNEFMVMLNRIMPILKESSKVAVFVGRVASIATPFGGRELARLLGAKKGIFGDQQMSDMPSGLTWNRLHMSAFEKMGFIMGNTQNPVEYQRQIAANTKRIADYIQNWTPARADRGDNFAAAPNMP